MDVRTLLSHPATLTVIALVGAMLVAAGWLLYLSIIAQKQYSKSTLPTLSETPAEEEAPIDDDVLFTLPVAETAQPVSIDKAWLKHQDRSMQTLLGVVAAQSETKKAKRPLFGRKQKRGK